MSRQERQFYLCDVDGMSAEGLREVGEERCDVCPVEVERGHHGDKEHDHLPHGDEGVGEVAGALQTVLETAQTLDRSWEVNMKCEFRNG